MEKIYPIREVAIKTIWTVLKNQGITDGRKCLELSTNEKNAIAQKVRESYPFSKKEGAEFRVWLSEFNRILGGLTLVEKRKSISKDTHVFQTRLLVDNPRSVRF